MRSILQLIRRINYNNSALKFTEDMTGEEVQGMDCIGTRLGTVQFENEFLIKSNSSRTLPVIISPNTGRRVEATSWRGATRREKENKLPMCAHKFDLRNERVRHEMRKFLMEDV